LVAVATNTVAVSALFVTVVEAEPRVVLVVANNA
jgi:hypothetical protein